MIEQLRIRPVIGLVLLQIGLFQVALWAHLAGDGRRALLFGGLTAAVLLAVGLTYWFALRRPTTEPMRRPGRRGEAPVQAAPPAGGKSRALVLGTLGFVVTFMVWGSISPLALQFKQLYALTNTQVSLLIAVPVLLGSVGRLPVGILADRFGPKRIYTLLVAFLVVPLLAMGFTTSYGSLMAVAFFMGVAGSSFSVGVPFVSRWFPASQQGLALGIFGMGNFGQALGVMYAPRVAAAFGWPVVYWSLIIPVVLTALAIGLFGEDAPKPAAPAGAKAVGGESIWLAPQAWLLSLFYFVSFGGFVAFSNYLPKLYQELHGLTPAQAGSWTALFVLGATLARPLGGWLSDKITADKVLLAIFALVLGGATLLPNSPALPVFAGATGLLALALGVGNGAVFKLVPQLFPGRTGAVTGMVGAMGGLGGFFPPLLMGLVRDQTGTYALGFVGLATFAVLCIGGVLTLMRALRRGATV